MREILAHPTSFSEDFFGGCANICHLGVEAKIPVYACGQIEKCLGHGAARSKGLQGVIGEFRPYSNARRFKLELIGVEAAQAMICFQRLGDLFP
jgi:hypothetical protein